MVGNTAEMESCADKLTWRPSEDSHCFAEVFFMSPASAIKFLLSDAPPIDGVLQIQYLHIRRGDSCAQRHPYASHTLISVAG
jgi:hypothetical protein